MSWYLTHTKRQKICEESIIAPTRKIRDKTTILTTSILNWCIRIEFALESKTTTYNIYITRQRTKLWTYASVKRQVARATLQNCHQSISSNLLLLKFKLVPMKNICSGEINQSPTLLNSLTYVEVITAKYGYTKSI